MGGLEAHPTKKFILCGTGILPVLDENLRVLNQFFLGGLEAHPTSKFILCGTGILPVLENASINIDRVKLWKNIQA